MFQEANFAIFIIVLQLPSELTFEKNDDELTDSDSSSLAESTESDESDTDSRIASLDESDGSLDLDENENWYNEFLYNGSLQTTGNAVIDIVDLHVNNKNSKKNLDETLRCMHRMLPQPNNLPRSKYILMKKLDSLFPKDMEMHTKHRICENCCEYIGVWSETAKVVNCKNSQCNSTSLGGAFFEFNTEASLKIFFEQRNLGEIVSSFANSNAKVPAGYVNNFSLGSKFKFWKESVIKNDFDLCLLWNVDGTPTSKSSKGSVWMIQTQIANIPIEKRRGFQLVNGIYYSRRKKPCMKSFFRPFVETMTTLSKKGIE